MSAGRPVIGIVDPCCPAPYGSDAPAERALGGTEATVLRVTDALQSDFRFRMFQAKAVASVGLNSCTTDPLEKAFQDRSCQAFIVINSWKVACRLRRFHPHVPISVWLHVYPGRHNREMGAALVTADIDVICVSKSHAEHLFEFLSHGALPAIGHIWNPIADDLKPDDTPRNLNRLLFCSSPHKGLAQVLQQFAAVRQELPALTLEVADPGYLSWDVGAIPEGVWLRGSLPHDRLLSRMRRALCLFYPQDSFAETFGLVIAESNAVGTPVLVQRGLGANDEVVCGRDQLIDARDVAQLVERIRQWQACFPSIQTHPEFCLSRVAGMWRQKLRTMLGEKALRGSVTQHSETAIKDQKSYQPTASILG